MYHIIYTFKCAIQCFLVYVYSQMCETITTVHFGLFLSPYIETPYLKAITFLLPHLLLTLNYN